MTLYTDLECEKCCGRVLRHIFRREYAGFDCSGCGQTNYAGLIIKETYLGKPTPKHFEGTIDVDYLESE